MNRIIKSAEETEMFVRAAMRYMVELFGMKKSYSTETFYNGEFDVEVGVSWVENEDGIWSTSVKHVRYLSLDENKKLNSMSTKSAYSS